MSQTWVIKDNAPISWPNISDDYDVEFISNNTIFSRFTINTNRVRISIGSGQYIWAIIVKLVYRLDTNNTLINVTNAVTVQEGEVKTGETWKFTDEAYRTLTFVKAPPTELLTWLQKNAELISDTYAPGIRYQDIHLEDKTLWNQLQTAWEQGDYTAALNVLKNANLTDKQLNAAAINALTTELLSLQAQGDPSFKTGQIVVASEPPSDLAVGKVYFRLIGPVTDYNEQNAYYIEINQKTSSGYDVLNPATQADNIALTENTAAKFGLVGVTYTLDKALYDVEQLLQVVTTT